MSDIDWLKLYQAAILEMNPDKLVALIGAAEKPSLNENHLWMFQN
jgi:hypothetical protein